MFKIIWNFKEVIMKIVVFILFVLIIIAVFMCGFAMGQGNPKLIITKIDSDIINAAFELHNIDECILHKAEGNESAYLYFYQGMKLIENPEGLRWCPFFSNILKKEYIETWNNKREKL